MMFAINIPEPPVVINSQRLLLGVGVGLGPGLGPSKEKEHGGSSFFTSLLLKTPSGPKKHPPIRPQPGDKP